MRKNSILRYTLCVLLAILLTALCLFMRFLTLEQPDWVSINLIYPLLGLCFVADGTWLMDLHMALTIAFAIMLIPCSGDKRAWRRYFIRPLIGIAVFLLLRTPTWGIFNRISDHVFFNAHASQYAQIREKIAESEYVLGYEGGSHARETLSQHLPELTTKGVKTYDDGSPVYYATDAILVDFDAPTLTFCDYGGPHDPTYKMLTVQLEPAEIPPYQYDFSREVMFDNNACSLTYYFTGEENLYGGDYTIVWITLRMPDGSLWITSDLIDPATRENYDIWLYPRSDIKVIMSSNTTTP